jgi:hypothetical protein
MSGKGQSKIGLAVGPGKMVKAFERTHRCSNTPELR